MAKKIRTVHVVEHGDEYLVIPAALIMAPGDTFKIVNHTDEDLAWVVTDNRLLGTDGPYCERVAKKSAHKPHAGKDVGRTNGVYRYKLLVGNDGTEAKGHSDPMIIIDPNP